MALLHSLSDECIKSELDLFSLPMTQTSIEKSTYIEIPPLSALTDGGPIEFFVSASSEDYIDLPRLLILMEQTWLRRPPWD